MQFNPRVHVLMEDGNVVERDVYNIVQKIREYDPNLIVQYCERPDDISDAPYRIVELCKDGFRRVLFSVWTLDDRVIERIAAADTNVFNVGERLEKHNAVIRDDQQRRYRERTAQVQDYMVSMLKSPKGRWSFKDEETGKLIEVDDDPNRKPTVTEPEC